MCGRWQKTNTQSRDIEVLYKSRGNHAFTSRIRALRKEAGEKQEETASAIGLTVRQYQRYEAVEQNPNLENFCALADHFGVSLDYLAGRTDVRQMAGEE